MTTENKHTPGPWEFSLNNGFSGLWGPNGEMLLSYNTRDDGVHCEPANARLIAAAPDLLESLEMMRDSAVIASVCPSPLWATINATIAKARGK